MLCISVSLAQTATAPSSGDGSAGNPYQIATLDNLYWLTQSDTSWSGYFVQTADIDASSSTGWNSGAGFTPIGNPQSSFTGTYDGQNHTIDSLFINEPDSDGVGMFGTTFSGTIRNLGLLNANVSGQAYVGVLVGVNLDDVYNCYTTGSVTASMAWDGGLVGLANGGSISRSWSSCSVQGSAWVGGLVGGTTNVAISNCYATGSAQGGGAGGLVANLDYSSITNSYSSASVGTFETGGLVGFVGSQDTVSNSFWDTQTSGQLTSEGGGTGKGTAAMKTQSTFTDSGWDFTTVWAISGSVNNGYPTLQNEFSLPVELVAFSATVEGLNAELKWNTATEVDNSGFEIERRLVNPQSSIVNSQFIHIGFVGGSGTSTGPKHYSFVDRNLSAGLYSYRLRQVDRNGASTYSRQVQVDVGTAPKVFSLGQNYPNPFNPSTTIEFTLPEDGRVKVKIFDVLGKEVATLLDATMTAGEYHRVSFDASHLGSGVYFARIQFANRQLVKKMLLMK